MTVGDDQIGRNVARLRGPMSQRDLADAMRERGWRWTQGTVSEVESGIRPLRLAEADDLARLLRQPDATAFSRTTWQGLVDEMRQLLLEARQELVAAIDQYHDYQAALAAAASDSRVEQADRDDARGLIAVPVEEILEERRRQLLARIGSGPMLTRGALMEDLLAGWDQGGPRHGEYPEASER